MVIWTKKTQAQIKKRVFDALKENVNYEEEGILGLPATYLDDKVFSQDHHFLQDAPYISTLIQNPNHIGCHTLGKSESYFKGTQKIEKEVIEICAVDILGGKPGEQDGYVASGGTEANIQAIWIYRNYFMQEFGAKASEICIVCSEDSHYSMDKSANLLSIDILKVKVGEDDRIIHNKYIEETFAEAKKKGKKYLIIIANMMTTMYGSVDKLERYVEELEKTDFEYKIHVDGAFGGFYFPFTDNENTLTFDNLHISSFTLDAHKMAQAPYGTGLFLIRKGLMKYANTQASYVEGDDFTLIGSRSGANTIAIWMILMKYGPYGWREKIFILQKRSEWICKKLKNLQIDFYRHPFSNIITIKSKFVSPAIAEKFGLIPDSHSKPNWYKIVVMDHVTIEKLIPLLEDLES